MIKHQGQSSVVTEAKERGLSSTFQSNLWVFRRLKNRLSKSRFKYFHFDLNCGSGWNEDVGCIGSPLAFVNAATTVDVNSFYAGFCDNNREFISKLSSLAEIGIDERCHCFNEDNAIFVKKIRDIIVENGENPDKVIGMILSDPNGTQIPIDSLSELSLDIPRLDIAIHWNSAAFKRVRGAFGVDRPTLELALSKIKKDRWLIRKPIGGWQWTMLIGRNYNSKEKIEGFYDLDSSSGQSIFAKCNYTAEQFKEFGYVLPQSIIHKQSAMCV
jgi:hypothetical protein